MHEYKPHLASVFGAEIRRTFTDRGAHLRRMYAGDLGNERCYSPLCSFKAKTGAGGNTLARWFMGSEVRYGMTRP